MNNTKILEQYIDQKLRTHNWSDIRYGLTKRDMYEILKQHQLPFSQNESWDCLFDKVLTRMTYFELAERQGIGVTSSLYQQTFGMTHQDVKRLERLGALRVVGGYFHREYGKNLKVPFYDIKQFENMTQEEMDDLLKKYPKGVRRKREKG